MTRITPFSIAICLALLCASTSLAGAPAASTTPGTNFDGIMSVIYNDVNGGVFIENSPNPNPSVQGLEISSNTGLLIPGNLAVPPANIVTATPNLIKLNAAGNFLGTGSFLGAILASGYSEPQLLLDLNILYNQAASPLTSGDLIHGSFGQLQAQPVLPNGPVPGSCCRFFNVATGNFYDPPLTTGYTYTMDSLSTFTKVGLPIGLGNSFTITSTQGTVTNVPENGQVVFTGLGVSSFTLTGISPAVDTQDVAAFPAYLEFSTPLASFTMTPVPEPCSALLACLAIFGACGIGARRR